MIIRIRSRSYWTVERHSDVLGWQLDSFQGYGILAFPSRQMARDYCGRKLAENKGRMRPVKATFTATIHTP
jgi:hypothetical protein